MKTAMQELIEDLKNNMVISIFERLEREGIFIKALEKEKNQILSEWKKGFEDAKFIYTPPNI
jgi:hypothetical protein